MANYEESRDVERSDALAASEDFAAQVAVVFEWHLARVRAAVPASRERSAPNELWMSQTTRRADATS